MGISGLLPLLKSIQRPTDLKKYAGETLAVDAYGWLHRGAISCVVELAQGRPTRKYVDSVLNRVRMVQHFGVTPYLVFDGDFLPSKAGTEASRARRREESRAAGTRLARAGQHKQAYAEFQKAIDVTPEMARYLIEELKCLGLPYVVAPYEADAQMVFLERHGHVSGILSEDSDLLVFGARRLITKLDMQGRCVEINRREFCACREIALTDWTDREFRHMAILSGCDYLDGVGNLGLKTAYRMIRKHKTVEKVVRMLQFDGKFKVSENYLTAFYQAELTFLHQRVFCPRTQKLVLLSEPDNNLDVDSMRFIGDKISHELARAIAIGDVNPITKEPIVLLPHMSPGKKRRASSSSLHGTAPTSVAGTQSSSGQPTLAKPISDYFKKKTDSTARIPLGAMDPNCFSVDREQVASLTQNGLVPRVFPLPRPYVDGGRTSLPGPTSRALSVSSSASGNPRLRRRQTEPLSSLSQPNSSVVTSISSSSSTVRPRRTVSMLPPTAQPSSASKTGTLMSTPPASARPQKKARLGAGARNVSSPSSASERSKYFASEVAPPLVKKSQTTTRRHHAEKFLMSDDSVEEAMLGLSDMDNWDEAVATAKAKVKTTVCVFEDNREAQTAEQNTQGSGGPLSDVIEVPESPVSHKSATSTTTTDATPFGARLSLSQFSYSGRATSARFAHGLPTPDSSFASSQETVASLARTIGKPSTFTPALSASSSTMGRKRQPLRRGERNGSEGQISLSDLVAQMQPTAPRRQKAGSLAKVRRSLEGTTPTTVNPSFVPLPLADLAEVETLNRVDDGENNEGIKNVDGIHGGSEDQLVPDSDRDEEDEEERGLTSSLDLSRFMCARA